MTMKLVKLGVLVVAFLFASVLPIVLWLYDWPTATIVEAVVCAAAVLGGLWYLHFGKDNHLLSVARPFYFRYVENSPIALTFLFVLLLVGLVGMAWLGFRSEMIVLVPDVDDKTTVQVSRLDDQESDFLGSATSEEPLTDRFCTGKLRLRFQAEGYQLLEKEIDVGARPWSKTPRHIPVALTVAESLHVSDLAQDNPGDKATEEVPPPPEAKHLPRRTLGLGLSSSAPRPIRVEGLELHVSRVEPLKVTTFPFQGYVEHGSRPIQGAVGLWARPGVYRVRLANKAKLGRGIEPDDFRIEAYCEPGHRFRLRVCTAWADLNRPQEVRRHSSEEQSLDLPAAWHEYARRSNDVKVFLSAPLLLPPVVEELQAIKPHRAYSVFLFGISEAEVEGVKRAAHVVPVPKGKGSPWSTSSASSTARPGRGVSF